MPFTPKAWADGPGGGTPINAAALADEERRLSAYTDTQTTDPSQLYVFGHSRNFVGSTYEDLNVAAKIAERFKARLSNFAHGGAVASVPEGSSIGGSANYGGLGKLLRVMKSPRTAAPYMPIAQCAVIDWGLCDMAWMGPTTFASVFPHALRSAVSRVRAGRVIEDNDALCTYTGASWSTVTNNAFPSTSYNSGTTVHQVTSNGDSVSIAIPADWPGGTLTPHFVTGDAGGGALWTITGTGSCSGVNTTFDARNINGFDFGSSRGATGKKLNSVKRLSGIPSGSGTLILTATTITTAAFFDCLDFESPTPGLVCCGLDARPVDYTVFNAWPYNPGAGYNDADVTTITSVATALAAEFDANVFVAAVDDLLNKQQVYFADTVHYNDLGSALVADRIGGLIQARMNQLQATEAAGFFYPYFYELDGSGPGGAFTNGWADYPGYTSGWRKETLTGMVYVDIACQKTTGSATDVIMNLGPSYRPRTNLLVNAVVYDGASYSGAPIAQINVTGDVFMKQGGSIATGNLNRIIASFPTTTP